ncbi:hypothetical protein [Streptomyces sp. NPDC005930]|uniref:hypothetical protein n=1 Tax=Streptomyces sp. NPDC005930 TaxID=3364736 RepID=UPI0036ABAF24
MAPASVVRGPALGPCPRPWPAEGRQSSNERTLRERIERAIREGDLAADTDAATLTGLVQSVRHGLSVRCRLGASREDLLATVRLVQGLVREQLTP